MTQKTILGVTLRRLVISFINGLGGNGHIHVRFRGRRAYTNGTMVNLPAIKDMAEIKYETARALIGYAIHEAAHIRHTNFKAILAAMNAGHMEADCLVKKFANGIEDYRIERIESKLLPGTASDLTALRNLIHPKPGVLPPTWYADPRQSGPLALTWTGSQLNGFIIPAMHDTLLNFPPPMRALIDNWTRRMDGVETTEDVIKLAIAFHEETLDYVKASQSGPAAQGKSADQNDDEDADDQDTDDENQQGPSSPDSNADADNKNDTSGSEPGADDGEAETSIGDSPEPGHNEAADENTSDPDQADNPATSGDTGSDNPAASNEQTGQPKEDQENTHSSSSAADPASGNNQEEDTQNQAPLDDDADDVADASSPNESATSGTANAQDNDEAGEAGTSAENDLGNDADTASGQTTSNDDPNSDGTNPQTGPELSDIPADHSHGDKSQKLPDRPRLPQAPDQTGSTEETEDEHNNSPDDDSTNNSASEPNGSEPLETGADDDASEDQDELGSVLEDNAAFDDFIDDLHDQIAQNPLPDSAPDGADGEVNPGSVIEDIKSANDVAPNYTSPDPDPNSNQSGKAGQGAAPHAYSDTRFQPIETNEGMGKYSELRSKASGVIATTARTIRRLLMAEEQKGTLRGRRSGQFDIRNISAVVRGTGNCYKKTWERPAPETELLILTDFSGSMFFSKGEKPIDLAMTGALAVEEATRNTQIQTSIYGYHGFSPNVHLYPFKEGKQAATITKKRIGAYDTIGSGCTPTGEAMAAAAEILDGVPGKRRVLLVLTDGVADDNKLCADLIPVFERRHIEVVAIGIQCESVKEWCPKSHVINDIAELPAALLAIIDPRANKTMRKAA